MPAAKRYTKSQLDEFIKALNDLPAGTPPEPDFSTVEVLDALEKHLRKRVLQDHVEIAAIVAELNARGFKVPAKDLKKRAAKIEGVTNGSRKKAVSPVRRRNEKAGASTQTHASAPDGRGSLPIHLDEDEI